MTIAVFKDMMARGPAAAVALLRELNRQTQVNLKIFLPVFFGALLLLAGLAALVPSPDTQTQIPVQEKGPSSRLNPDTSPAGRRVLASNAAQAKKEWTDLEKQAVAVNDSTERIALAQAPIATLEEDLRGKRLPKIADDGRKPWFVYSRPFSHADPRPRIAVIVADLGLERLTTESAINDLPGAVTLVFGSGASTAAWMGRARSMGHEVILSASMEPFDYPANDPGPGTLLINNTAETNLRRLRAAMAAGAGYVGMTTLTGSRFTSSPTPLRPVLKDVAARGMIWLDSRLAPLSSAYALAREIKAPALRADFRVTPEKSRDAIDTLFQDAETSARHSGAAVVLVYATPMALQAIADWTRVLPQRGFALAPATAMVE